MLRLCLSDTLHEQLGNYYKSKEEHENNREFHYVKSVRIRSFSGLHFPAFELNTEIYFANLPIQSKCGKIWTIKTPNTDTFYTVFTWSCDGA